MVARVSGFRAAIEAGLVAAVLVIALLAIVPAQNTSPVWQAFGLGFFDIGCVAGVVAALRMRRSTDSSRARTIAREVGLLALTVFAIVVAMSAAAIIATTLRPALESIRPAWIPHAALGAGGVLPYVAAGAGGTAALISFAIARPLVVLWPSWDRLRRTRLVWSITHAQLLASLAIASVVGLVLLATFLVGEGGPFGDPDLEDPLLRALVGFIASITGGLFVVGLATLFVLPIAAIISYLAIRPTTRRLDQLTTATAALREGTLAARVPVEGEDEVAHLQTDFNAMAADLERSVRELEAERDTVSRLLVARRELVTAVSHELRTPVATIRAYLDSSLEHWDGAPPGGLRRDLEVMARETERLQRLIEDLFTLSRAEGGSLQLAMAPVAVEPVLARSVEAVRPLARDRSKVDLLLDVSGDLPAILADEGRLEQIVRNLIANAVRHTPPGGVVRVSAEDLGQQVAVRVEDTGEGIAPAELDRVWERFYRTGDARDRDRGGAGLGLALVKELAEAMDGRVEVESTLGVGSRFSVYLPATREVPVAHEGPAATPLRQTDNRAATTR